MNLSDAQKAMNMVKSAYGSENSAEFNILQGINAVEVKKYLTEWIK